LINGDVAARITELKQQPGRNIGMSGSSDLVSWLLRHGLLDQLDLLVFRSSWVAGSACSASQTVRCRSRWPARKRSARGSCT
jgi:dihydrofolate reductase